MSEIAGYCRECGQAQQEADLIRVEGTIYCKEHAPAAQAQASQPQQPPPLPQQPSTDASSPYNAPVPPPVPPCDVSPGLAFLLGWIPGVGAIYNGQYAKGMVHVVITGLLISIMDRGSMGHLEPLFGITLAAFWFYMAFEAMHTAKQRRRGQPVDEFSSILPLRPASCGRTSRFPAAPIALIVVGIVFLLDNLGLLDISSALKFWPVLLIAMGCYMLYHRIAGTKESQE